MFTLRPIYLAAMLLLTACAGTSGNLIIHDTTSSLPGSSVTLRGKTQNLLGTPIKVGMPLPAATLIDAMTMDKLSLSQRQGKVLIVSLVPSLDTAVCEEQTHYLGEKANLHDSVELITISRDTPFAQKRFAKEAKLHGITFLSDYREGAWGRSTGLLIEDSMLLARAIIIADATGIVRYIQVVPELSHLPDMEAAFAKAREMAHK